MLGAAALGAPSRLHRLLFCMLTPPSRERALRCIRYFFAAARSLPWFRSPLLTWRLGLSFATALIRAAAHSLTPADSSRARADTCSCLETAELWQACCSRWRQATIGRRTFSVRPRSARCCRREAIASPIYLTIPSLPPWVLLWDAIDSRDTASRRARS